MERQIFHKLLSWKDSKNRKPLIIKGIRQVGKTYILKEFGRKLFPCVHYFNFEKKPELAQIFLPNLDPDRIVTELNFHIGKKIDLEHDLIIFDEIQACPKALTSLKYFCEDFPEAYICCAGSLLGVYLGPASYPVGKVDKLQMHPMSFIEFLMAIGDEQAVELLNQVSETSVISDFIHNHLWEQLKKYFIVGGLPEVVAIFREHQEDLYTACIKTREKQRTLIDDYFSDIAKHAGKVDSMHIHRIWQSVSEQLALEQDGSAKKFKFKNVVPGIDRYSKLVNAIDWLENAGLILKVHIANQGEIPLKAYVKENTFKLYLFDVGILGALSDLDPKSILDYDYGSYKGFFAENYVAQAFTYGGADALYSWSGKKSEVEFLRQIDNHIIPIEVKAGRTTQAKSLRVYAERFHPPYRMIISGKKLSIDKPNKIYHYPLYLAANFPLRNC
ncbi:MAG: hypothetical protein K940chlam7_01913 [Chlamydiae bacterium]|nr:hypothetical protein [Chlamydiota bacterium]